MPRVKQRTPELRERMLAAAVELLAREGAGGLTARGVANAADTSAPALYELFGDRAGLVRALFFEGHRRLAARLEGLERTSDPRADLLRLFQGYREFTRENAALSEVMFARPFRDFEPTTDDLEASAMTRALIVDGVERAVAAGLIAGDVRDISLILATVTQGLAAAENGQRLGASQSSVDRRWDLALGAVLDGLRA